MSKRTRITLVILLIFGCIFAYYIRLHPITLTFWPKLFIGMLGSAIRIAPIIFLCIAAGKTIERRRK